MGEALVADDTSRDTTIQDPPVKAQATGKDGNTVGHEATVGEEENANVVTPTG